MRFVSLSPLGCWLVASVLLAQASPARHGYMHPDAATQVQWREEDRRLPRVTAASLAAQGRALAPAGRSAKPETLNLPAKSGETELPAAADVLDLLSYVPAERDQGTCGNCWVWGSTALVEVALAAQYGLKDRLSIQFLNAARTAEFACGGGSLPVFASWYNTQKVLIPWSNPNGGYQDGAVNSYCAQSLVDPAAIGRAPGYALSSLTAAMLDPAVTTQEQMITTLKTALAMGKAVGLSYYTDFESSDGFSAWWERQDEAALWGNPYEGKIWNPATWGAHMVTLVGYDAQAADPSQHAWLVLNSWGATAGRPGGLFRLPMRLNHQAVFTAPDGKPSYCYLFRFVELEATPPAAVAPTVQVSASAPLPLLGEPLTLTAQVTGTAPLAYQWHRNGLAIAGATSAQLVLPRLEAADADQAFAVAVGNAAGQQTSAPVAFPVAGQQLLLQPGLEEPGVWTATSSLGLNPWRSGDRQAHSGSGYVCLGGSTGAGVPDPVSSLTQLVRVPDLPGTVTLGFWLRMVTAETGPEQPDRLRVSVLDEAGAPLVILANYANPEVAHLVWRRASFELAAYKGRTIQLRIEASQDGQRATAFLLDDITLVAAPPQPSLALTAGAGLRLGGDLALIDAQIRNATDNQLLWSVTGGSLAQASTAAASASNAWTLPLTSGHYALEASLRENPRVQGRVTLQVVGDADIAVAVAPSSATLLPGQALLLGASGDGGGGVAWTGDAGLDLMAYGTQAVATAPLATPIGSTTYQVRAVSSLNPAKGQSVALTVRGMDLDRDGAVAVPDLLVLAAQWGLGPDAPANLKGAGAVDDSDLAALLAGLR